MARRAGTADLPLPGGHVPKWLAERMTRLGAVISEAIVHHYGRDELLRRLAHPFWFQSFGAVMGMDWHSSGITTGVIGALKRGLAPLAADLGVHVCGGRGKHSRQTRAPRLRPVGTGADRTRAAALGIVRRPQPVRLGARPAPREHGERRGSVSRWTVRVSRRVHDRLPQG